jgi:hypothetical protein
MKTSILAIVVFLSLTGCASLHLQPTDSTGTKIAKGFARVPVAILTFGLSEAWHQRERTMKSWLGHHESDLFMSWGPPHAVLEDGSGGRILVYAENRMYVSPGHATTTSSGTAYGQVYGNQVYVQGQGQSHTTYTPAQVHQWQVYRQFRVNSSGQIVQYSWRGL